MDDKSVETLVKVMGIIENHTHEVPLTLSQPDTPGGHNSNGVGYTPEVQLRTSGAKQNTGAYDLDLFIFKSDLELARSSEDKMDVVIKTTALLLQQMHEISGKLDELLKWIPKR